MTKLWPGLYAIQFAGVDHAFSERKYLYIDSTMTCTVDAQLERSSFLSLEALDTLFVRYEDPTGGNVERSLQPMEYLGDGRFRAQLDLPGKTDPLWDLLEVPPVLAYHIQGIVVDRWVNGTDQDYFYYDGGGDFFSVKKIEDTVLTVDFDYNVLTGINRSSCGQENGFFIEGASLNHPYAMLERRKRAYRDITRRSVEVYADKCSTDFASSAMVFRGKAGVNTGG